MNTKKQAAIKYAQEGMKVIPLNKKIPITGSHGYKDGTTNEQQIEEWWEQKPSYDVGLVLNPGNFVLDIDRKEGVEDGFDSLKKLYDEMPELEDLCKKTVAVATGGGGRHFYFSLPKDVVLTRSAGVVGKGLDIITDKSYIVAPPSAHESGGRYKFLPGRSFGEAEILPAPQALIDKIKKTKHTTPENQDPNETIYAGTIHNAFASRIGIMINGRKFSRESIRAAITNENEKCDVPYTQKEVDEIVDDMWGRYAGKATYKNETKTAVDYVEEIKQNSLIRFFRDRFYHYDGKIWAIDDDKEHIKTKRIIVDTIISSGGKVSLQLINLSLLLLKVYSSGFAKEKTRYSMYLFDNGTLYFDEGNYTFAENGFRPEDDIRDDENPMFPYEFSENQDVSEVIKVFREWGVDARQLLEIISHCLFVSGNPFNLLYYLYGEGANGKSQYLKLLEHLCPDGCITHQPPKGLTGDKDGSERLEKSYINTVSEVIFKKFDATILKNVLGDEQMHVNPKYQTPYDVKPTCKWIVSSNEEIELLSTHKGDIRRFLQIPFTKEFEIDTTFFDKRLKPYLSRIFYYCLQRSQKLFQNNLYSNKKYMEETKNTILSSSSTVHNFIEEFGLEESEDLIDCRHIYPVYREWITELGQKPLSAKNFWKWIGTFLPKSKKTEGRSQRFLIWNRELNREIMKMGGKDLDPYLKMVKS